MALLFDSFGNPVRSLPAQGGDLLVDSRPVATLASLNAETVIDVGQESTAIIDVRGTFVATITASVSADGTNWTVFPIWNPVAEVFLPAITVAGIYQLDIPTGAKKIRLVNTLWTSGAAIVTFRAGLASKFLYAKQIPATLCVSVTGATGAAVTATLPAAGTGLFQYISRLLIQRHTSALLTAGATPTIVTTTNMAGGRQFSLPADAAAQGAVFQAWLEQSQPIKASLANTALTIVCPATTGVIWRVTVDYYVGA